MSVVNCKVQYIRPQYQNLKEWVEDYKNNIYIGRKGVVFIDGKRYPPYTSRFANPFKIGKHGTREEVLLKYREYIVDKMDRDEIFRRDVLKLKGKRLGCWCCPEKCHGDILLQLIEEHGKENKIENKNQEG